MKKILVVGSTVSVLVGVLGWLLLPIVGMVLAGLGIGVTVFAWWLYDGWYDPW